MTPLFEEIDYQKTPLGELVLQRRRMLSLNGLEVYEVKLGEEYLMSSLFHEAEVALADIAFAELDGERWDVVIGGLGLGYTAAAALKYRQVARLVVVEALAPVIHWHKSGLVPNGSTISNDKRSVYHHSDFFALTRGAGFDPAVEGKRFDAILLDIDHTPDALLNASHGDFYTQAGLDRLKSFLKPKGVFALWSNDPPDDSFVRLLSDVFGTACGNTITFDNPLQQSTSANGIYVARGGPV